MRKLIKVFSSSSNNSLLGGEGDGIKCGKGWISRDKKCSKDASESASKSLDLFSNAVEAGAASAAQTQQVAPNIDELNKYFEDGEIFSQNVGIFKTIAGAMGIQAYFSSEYPEINKFFYDKDYRENEATEDIKMKANAAVIGFEELPTHTKEEIQEYYKNIGVDYDKETLYRGLSFSSQDQLEAFLSTHKENSDIVYEAFTSTTLANPASAVGKVDGGWSRKPIQITIKQKENTAGKWVDERKHSKNEAEILFNAGTKFRVAKVESDERERLPARLQDPIQDIFGKEDEGLGLKTLPISALIGEKSPQAILEDESFAFFKQFIKKKGIPPASEWHNLTFKDIFSISNMKGGKFLIANEIIKALQDQVKPNEHTGIIEHSNVKIYLEEL